MPTETRRGIPVVGPLLTRPYLVVAVALGAVVYFVSAPWFDHTVTRALIGWNAGVVVFLFLTFTFMRNSDPGIMKRRALAHDEGGHLILLLTIIASVASVGAIIAELSIAKDHPDAGWRVALAAGTVVLSWLFVQIVFAMHYAHVYYMEEEVGRPKGGLEFGECGEPDYWDFVHFSIVLGATSQTADITFSTRQMRRIGTLHTLVAFGFNTAILATMINLAAGLF